MPAKEAVKKAQDGVNERTMTTRSCGFDESHPAFVTKLLIHAAASVAAVLVFLPVSTLAQTDAEPELTGASFSDQGKN